MLAVTARWEWRTFGPRFGCGGPPRKVRDDLMDIKALRKVDADGLEQWMPVMKAGFPLPAAEVARVFAALRLDPPPVTRARYRSMSSLTSSPRRAAPSAR